MAALTRPEAATLALFALGGESTTIDTEDIAVRTAEVAPGMFAWQKYRDRIDKELVRVALSDAKLKSGFVIGSHSKGWMLTPKGRDFARRASAQSSHVEAPVRRGTDDRRVERERARLLTTDAYLRYAEKVDLDTLSADEVDAFFRLNVYVRGEARLRKINGIENQFGDDQELGAVVKALAERARERQ
jgi:hypothetical protein